LPEWVEIDRVKPTKYILRKGEKTPATLDNSGSKNGKTLKSRFLSGLHFRRKR